MVDYWRMSALGGVMSGSIGVQGHYANGLAALFIACGQDAACVAEAAVGVTRFELRDDGGAVCGGDAAERDRRHGRRRHAVCRASRPVSRSWASPGPGHARAFAEVAAALVLAGELSIIGALAAGHFTRAHQRLARGPSPPRPA